MILVITTILSLTAAIGTDANQGCDNCALPPTSSCSLLQNTTKFVSDNGELNSKGTGDKADVLSNIRDTCNGNRAKRSTYCCTEDGISACAEGGSVCLSHTVLLFIRNIIEFLGKVISIVGGCHTNSTSSYDGQRVQFVIESSSNETMVANICSEGVGTFSNGPSHASQQTLFCDFTTLGDK